MIDTRRDKIVWNITIFLCFSERHRFFPKFRVFSSFHFFRSQEAQMMARDSGTHFWSSQTSHAKKCRESHLDCITWPYWQIVPGESVHAIFRAAWSNWVLFNRGTRFVLLLISTFGLFFFYCKRREKVGGYVEASKQLKITFDRHYFYRRQLSATYPR